jgi:hypothetical protein
VTLAKPCCKGEDPDKQRAIRGEDRLNGTFKSAPTTGSKIVKTAFGRVLKKFPVPPAFSRRCRASTLSLHTPHNRCGKRFRPGAHSSRFDHPSLHEFQSSAMNALPDETARLQNATTIIIFAAPYRLRETISVPEAFFRYTLRTNICGVSLQGILMTMAIIDTNCRETIGHLVNKQATRQLM